MSDDIVVVDSVSGIVEAELLRSLLESAGVTVELSREAALSAYALGVGRMARVDLLVRKDQETLARAVLDDYRSGKLIAPEPDPSDDTPQPD